MMQSNNINRIFVETERKEKMFFRNSKKGNSVLDAIIVVLILIVFSIVAVVGFRVLSEINTDIQADASMNQDAKYVTGNLASNYDSLFDNLFLFGFVLLVIFNIISVFMLDTHPIFFMVTVVLLIFGVIIVMLLGNVYDDLMGDATFSSYANNFNYIGFVFRNIGKIFLGYAFIISTVLFIKFKTT